MLITFIIIAAAIAAIIIWQIIAHNSKINQQIKANQDAQDQAAREFYQHQNHNSTIQTDLHITFNQQTEKK